MTSSILSPLISSCYFPFARPPPPATIFLVGYSFLLFLCCLLYSCVSFFDLHDQVFRRLCLTIVEYGKDHSLSRLKKTDRVITPYNTCGEWAI